jgi:hypothetical protein
MLNDLWDIFAQNKGYDKLNKSYCQTSTVIHLTVVSGTEAIFTSFKVLFQSGVTVYILF